MLRSLSGKLKVPVGEPSGEAESDKLSAPSLWDKVAQSRRELSNHREGEPCCNGRWGLCSKASAAGDIEKLSREDTSKEFKLWNWDPGAVGSVVEDGTSAPVTRDERNRYLKNRPVSLSRDEPGTLYKEWRDAVLLSVADRSQA